MSMLAEGVIQNSWEAPDWLPLHRIQARVTGFIAYLPQIYLPIESLSHGGQSILAYPCP